MHQQNLLDRAIALETKIRDAEDCDRSALHAQLNKVLSDIERAGERVPARLRRLELDLRDQEIEACFDNMPV